MSNPLNETLSALMDDEAEELELRRLLAATPAQPIDQTWSRYQLTRDAMQNNQQALAFAGMDISARVSAAIEQEQAATVHPSSRFSLSRFASAALRPVAGLAVVSAVAKPVAGFAVAASVAMAVVVGVQNSDSLNPGFDASAQPQAVASSRVYPVRGASLQASEGTGGAVLYRNSELPGAVTVSQSLADQQAQQRLEKFMLRHTEQTALDNGQGMISFARVVSFDVE